LNACPYRATEILHRRPLIVEFYRHDNYSDEAGFKAQLSYDKIQETLELLAKEVASNFQQQLVGFIFLVAGSALQLYGTTPCS